MEWIIRMTGRKPYRKPLQPDNREIQQGSRQDVSEMRAEEILEGERRGGAAVYAL